MQPLPCKIATFSLNGHVVPQHYCSTSWSLPLTKNYRQQASPLLTARVDEDPQQSNSKSFGISLYQLLCCRLLQIFEVLVHAHNSFYNVCWPCLDVPHVCSPVLTTFTLRPSARLSRFTSILHVAPKKGYEGVPQFKKRICEKLNFMHILSQVINYTICSKICLYRFSILNVYSQFLYPVY